MKSTILLSLFLLCFAALSFAQSPVANDKQVNDTANTPYWVDMMQDPDANFFATQRAFDLYWKDREMTKGTGWKSFKRWEYIMRQRVSKDGVKPDKNATAHAMKAYFANSAKSTKEQGGNWTCLGPDRVPDYPGYQGLGRLNTIAFHPTNPQKIYVGSPSGGLWVSDDLGFSWETHTDRLESLGVSAIIVDYSNPNNIYIGTGDRDAGDAPGMGVYKSTDGGLTWAQSSSGIGEAQIFDMLQHPSVPTTLIATSDKGIFKSIDGGLTWTNSSSVQCKDICFNPANPDVVYASLKSQFYRSIDGGENFTRIVQSNFPTSTSRSILAVSPKDPSCVYILFSRSDQSYGGVYKSYNQGDSFVRKSASPNILDWTCYGNGSGGQGWYDLALAVDPADTNLVYVGGVDCWMSSDAGKNWDIIAHWYGDCGVAEVHADWHYLAYAPNGTLWACTDGGLHFSTDGGASWTDRTEGMVIGQMYKLSQSKQSKEQVITGFQDNGTYTYQDGTWLATGGGDGMECIIDYSDESYAYYSIYYGRITRTHYNMDDGMVAGMNVGGIDEEGNWVTPYTLHPTNPNVMFIGYNSVWRCNNVKAYSPQWTNISPDIRTYAKMDVLKTSMSSPSMLYASRGGNLFRTPNAMIASPVWENLSANVSLSTINGIETHPIDSNIVYVVGGNQVFKSSDKGVTWTDITQNLADIYINDISFYNRGEDSRLFLATSAGVWQGTDSTGWELYSNGLPTNIDIREIDFYYGATLKDDAIRACSYGRGLWESQINSIVAVKPLPLKESTFVVLPNPNPGHFSCKIKIQKPTDYTITVLDLNGKTIYKTPERRIVTSEEIPINLGSIPNGVYTVVYKSKHEKVSQKVVVAK